MCMMVIKETVAFVKNFILSNLPKVHYFSDSCSGQYNQIVKTFLTSVTMNMILTFLVFGLSLQQATESPHVMALVAPLKGLQSELVFNDYEQPNSETS